MKLAVLHRSCDMPVPTSPHFPKPSPVEFNISPAKYFPIFLFSEGFLPFGLPIFRLEILLTPHLSANRKGRSLMLPGSGRPRTACSQCKTQKVRAYAEQITGHSRPIIAKSMRRKVRCSGNKPICKRCARLGRACVYGSIISEPRKVPRPAQITSTIYSPPTVTAPFKDRDRSHPITFQAEEVGSQPQLTPATLFPLLSEHYRLGIPPSLVGTLIEVYFSNVYNASLLLHKRSFLEAIAAGTARPHVVLGVCAWASK